jgi:hypothetical protein
MANSEHLAKLLEGAAAWNKWRTANAEIVPDLSEADLIMADLSHANLGWANLSRANLSMANIFGANLSRANLGGANLTVANLVWADLIGADLTEAIIAWTTFGNNDLSDVKGLETVRHIGPSTIGIDTILPRQDTAGILAWGRCSRQLY